MVKYFRDGYSLVFWLFGQQIIGLITDLSAVVDTAMRYLPGVIALPLIGHWSYWLDGVFIGLSVKSHARYHVAGSYLVLSRYGG